MLGWFFIVYFMGANVPDTNIPEIKSRVFFEKTETLCNKRRREELENLVSKYKGGVITSCKRKIPAAIPASVPKKGDTPV